MNGSGSVSANLFGLSLASIGVAFDAQLTDATGSVDINLSVSVHVHILFFTIGGTAHFDIGVVQFPKPFYLAGDGSGTTNGTPNAQIWNPTATNGTLYLNTGALEQYRGLGPTGDTSTASGAQPVESYTLDDEGGNAQTGETIKVTAFGQSQTFTGVKRIVDNASDSSNIDDESLIVDPGVHVPVVFVGGPNNNTFVDNGNGYAVGYGGGSNSPSSDVNDLEAGPNVPSALLVGGPAFSYISNQSSSPSFLIGGAGNNQILGGSGADTIYGHATISSSGVNNFQSYTSGAWTLSLASVNATDDTNASVTGSDTIDGDGGNDFIDAGNGNNAVDWPLQPITVTQPFLAGTGTEYLYIEGTNYANNISVTNPSTGTIDIADLSSTGVTIGNLTAQGFNNLVLNGGATTNNFKIADLGTSGIQNITLNAGQDIVPTGATQTVSDPSDPGQMIQEPVVSISPHSGADSILILGDNGNDTFTASEDAPGTNGQMTQILVTGTDSIGTTIDYTITNSVVAQGDTLTIDTLNGNSTINASALGSPTDPADYPQLINLVEQAGSGTDTLIASPTFNDTIHLGTGSDTVYGGLGLETFVQDPGATGTETLIESHNVDFGLYNDKLVMGTALQDGGGSMSFEQYQNTLYQNESSLVSSIQHVNATFPGNGMGNNFAAGSVIEPINNLFSVVELLGGTGNDTMVVNSPTGTINVGGSTYNVAPFAGSATLNSGPDTAPGVEYYVINFAQNNAAHINIADTGGTSGDKVVMVNGTSQGDNFTLNANGGGGFRVGTVVDSGPSNMSLSFRGSGIVRLVLDTLGGNDNILVNDTAVPTFIQFGSGEDEVVVGTVPLVPDTSNRTLEYPNGVPVVNTQAMTNGNSNDLLVMGGSGDDTFEVDHNSAMVYLHGGSGINTFLLKTFLVLRGNASDPSQITNLNTIIGGAGSNRYEYLQNAPVDIIGGTGFNTLVIEGTPLADTFVIGTNYVAGAGIFVPFTNIQSLEVDGAGGNDTIYVMGSNPNLSITVNGGPGDNTINIGGDPPPLVFNPPPFTYTPPAVEIPQPPKAVTTEATQTFSNITLNVNAIVFDLELIANNFNVSATVQYFLGPFLASFGANVPDFVQVGNPVISGISAAPLYYFFNPFQFLPQEEISVSSVTITYDTTVLVPQPPVYIQPPSVTVTQPPYIFQAPANDNAATITGAIVINGGQGEQVNGNTVIFHDQSGAAGSGFLRVDTFPQLTSVGQVTPTGYTTPVPLLGLNGTNTQQYLTLGGFGIGISPTSGVLEYPSAVGNPPVQFESGITPPVFDGVELQNVQNFELLLPSDGNTVQVESVPSDLNLTVDPGSGTNTIDLGASGNSTTLDTGAGNNTIVVGQNGQLNQILSKLTVDGSSKLVETTTPQTGLAVGESLLTNLPSVFINTQTPTGSFQGSTNGDTLSFSAANATITRNAGSWITDGFLDGDRIAVSGTGTGNDSIYSVATVTANILTLVAGSTLITQSSVASVSVIAEVHMAPIIEPLNSGNPAGPLEEWAVVLDSSGNIIQDQVQEWGSQEYGVQATDGSGNPLYYDQEGNQTTNASLTGIPVINQVAAGSPGALPVYYNASNEEVLGSGTGETPVYVADFQNGSPLYSDNGNLTTTPTSHPFLIPVNRTNLVNWTVSTINQVAAQGTTVITLDDSADSSNVTTTVASTQIPVNQLANGQPVYDGGATSPTAAYYFGGEPVIDPFTGQPLYYSGGEPVLNLLTGQPERDPYGNPILHKAGDPMLHVAGDPVVHSVGNTVVYLGGELVIDQNGHYVDSSALMTGSPGLTFAAATSGNPATITRSAGNWLMDSFSANSEILVSGTPYSEDDGVYQITAIDVTGTILSVVPATGSVTPVVASGVTVQGLLTYGGGETAIHNALDPVMALINAQGQPVPIEGPNDTSPLPVPYVPQIFSAPFGNTLNLSGLNGFSYHLQTHDQVNLVVYVGTAIYQLPASDFTVNSAQNTISLTAALPSGTRQIAVSIASQALHSAGDPIYYYGDEPLQVGQPVVDATGNLVFSTAGTVELYTAATIGNNASQIFDYNGGSTNSETFTLKSTPDGYIDITIAGTDLPATSYQISGDHVTVSPSFTPALGSQVVITYRLSIMEHQRGEPVYQLTSSGIWLPETYAGGEPEYYLGNEPLLYLSPTQVYYTNTQALPAAAPFHVATATGGMLGTLYFRGVAGITLEGGIGNNTDTIVQTQLGAFGTPGTDSSTVTIDTGNGNDQVAIDSIQSPVTIHAGNGHDTIDVGTLAGLWPNVPPSSGALVFLNVNGVVAQITAALTISGGAGTDTLNIDNTADTATDSATLTSSQLTGFGMTGSIAYSSISLLNINLGAGAETFTLQSTQSGTTTNVQGGDGGDIVNVRTISGPTNIGLGTDTNTVNVGSLAGVNGFNFQGVLSGIGAALAVNGQPLPALFSYPASNPASADFVLPRMPLAISAVLIDGTLIPSSDYSLSGTLLTLTPPSGSLTASSTPLVSITYTIQNPGFDSLIADDSNDASTRTGSLTSSTILGLGMASTGIVYNNMSALYIQLGLATDTFAILSTHAGTTNINGGPGNDTFNVGSIEGGTEIQGYDPVVPTAEPFTGLSDATFVRVHPMLDNTSAVTVLVNGVTQTYGTGYTYVLGTQLIDFPTLAWPQGVTGTVEVEWNGDPAAYARTNPPSTVGHGDTFNINVTQSGQESTTNGVGALLAIDPQQGTNTINAFLTDQPNAESGPVSLIDVHDSGPINDINTLNVYGSNSSTSSDEFLVRANFVAIVQIGAGGQSVTAERVNYDSTVNNGGLFIFGRASNDLFALDDSSAKLTIDGGTGSDNFQVGQLFQSPTNDPQYPFADDLVSRVETTAGWLSNGVSQPATLIGGTGADTFTVFRNVATLNLLGGATNNLFVIRAFALYGSQASDSQAATNVHGGSGANLIEYAVNAPVNVFGGTGSNTVVVLGTTLGDQFVITPQGVFGAGLFATLINIQYLTIDGLAGDNHFVVLGTDPGVVTHIYGGEGSNTFDVGGNSGAQPLQVSANEQDGYNGLISQTVTSSDPAYNGVVTGQLSASIGDANQAGVVVTPIGPLSVVESANPTVNSLSSATLDGTTYAEYSVVLTQAPMDGQSVAVDVSGDGVPQSLQQPIEFYSPANPPANGQPTFATSLVLSFNAANWYIPQNVYVVAQADATPQGALQSVTQSFTDTGSNVFDLSNLARAINSVTVAGNALSSSSYSFSGATLTIDPSALATGDAVIVSYNAPNGATTTQIIENSVTATVPSGVVQPYDDYRNATARALSIAVTDTDSGGAILTPVNPTTGLPETSTTVFKGSTTGDAFDVLLSHAPLAGETVTVSFSVPQSLVLSYQGNPITSLSFTTANWNVPDLIIVTDPQNNTVVGQYTAQITSTISTNMTPAQGSLYADIASPSLSINVVDDNSAGVLVQQSGGATTVIEATPGLPGQVTQSSPYTASYTVVLTKRPAANVTVSEYPQTTPTGGTLTEQFTYSSIVNNQISLLLTPALLDSVTIAGVATTSYSWTAGTNTVTLTASPAPAPTDVITVTYQFSGSASNLVLTSPTGQSIAGGGIALTFTTINWNIPQTIVVHATDDNVINGQQVVVFPSEPRTVDQVQGPLYIDGGADPAINLNAPAPLMFVGESNPPVFVPPNNPNLLEQKPQAVDTLNVLNNDEVASVTGTLTDTTITGLGMGANTVIGGQAYAGGITYNNIQDVNISLGAGNDNFLVASTDGGATTINGGSGTDQVNIETTSGLLTVNSGSGTSTIDVGTNYSGTYFGTTVNHFTAPAGGVLSQIDGLLRVNGGGPTTLNLDNSGATDPSTSVLTGSTLTGLDLHAAIVQTVLISHAVGGTFSLTVGPNGPTITSLLYGITAAALKSDLLGLDLPNVTNVMVNQADSTYTIDFVGGAAIQGENLTITANGAGLIPDGSGNSPSIEVAASQLSVLQSITVAPTAGSVPVTIGAGLGTITVTPNTTAAELQSALINAIRAIANPIVSASGVPVGTNDIQVAQTGNAYYVLYQGLLGGTTGDRFLLSVPRVATATVQGTRAVSLVIKAVGGTYTIVTRSGPTYELAWNASASAIQSALGSLLSSNTISVTGQNGSFTITNLPTGIAAGLSIDSTQLNAPVVVAVQGQGIAYNNVTTLNLDLDPYDNVVNIQGTTAVTNIFGHGGNEQFFVSSRANETQQSAQTADFLLGNLDSVLGNLNLAAGNGVHKLYISDEGSVSGLEGTVGGVTAGLITSNTSGNPTALPGTEIEVDGFAPAPIDYQAGPQGIFAGGITYWTGYGTVNVTIDNVFQRAGINNASNQRLRTITTLNTGLGTHDITVNLTGTASQGGLFVLNTQGPFANYPTYTNTSTVNASASTLPLIIFGGQGSSSISGGSGSDIIFGHGGQVVYDNAQNQPVTILGNGGPGDTNSGLDLPVSSVYTIGSSRYGPVTISGGPSTAVTTPTPSGGAVYGTNAPADSNIIFGEGAGTITGGEGNDIIFGGFGSISLTGGVPTLLQSTAALTTGNETITGGAGSDIILGGPGANTLAGGKANSVIIGSTGEVEFSGGRIVYVTTTMPGSGGTDRITGGIGNDIILGNAGADTITGGSGNDLILGHDGVVVVDQGLPTIATSLDPSIGGNDTIFGGTGNDVILAGTGNSAISGGSGNDLIIGHDGTVTFSGTLVNSAATTDPTDSGADSIIAGNGTNVVFGGSGNNSIRAGSGSNILVGANATATFASGLVTTVSSTYPSNAGSDTIRGGTGTDIIIGGSGSNMITTAGTADWVVASDGTASFSSGVITSLSTIDPATGGSNRVFGGNGNDVIIGGPGTTTIAAGNGNNVILGHDGTVVFTQGQPTSATTDPTRGGADTIGAGTGNNLIMGGTGNNTITIAHGSSQSTKTPPIDVILGANGTAKLASGLVTSIENSTTDPEAGGNNTITGGGGVNTIIGGPGINMLTGVGKSDVLIGGDGQATFSQGTILTASTLPISGGTETLIGGPGNEVLIGGGSSVTITGGSSNTLVIGHNGNVAFTSGNPTSASATDTTTSGTASITAGSAYDLVLAGNGNNSITGGSGTDLIAGTDATAALSNWLVTALSTTSSSNSLGSGTIKGGTGTDLVIAGTGNYKITGNGQNDVLVGSDASATFTAAGLISTLLSATPVDGGTDSITGGIGRDVLIGGAGSDTMTAGRGIDVILGHGGTITFTLGEPTSVSTATTPGKPDKIVAGPGADLVLGGIGNNTITVAQGSGNEVLVGANATATLSSSGLVTSVKSTNPDIGGNNTITGGGTYDVIIGGGPGNNILTGGSGNDVILGANGSATVPIGGQSIFTAMVVTSTSPGIGGTETIKGGNGSDVLIAGPGNATITGGNGPEMIFGGDATVTLSGTTVGSYASTDIGPTGGGNDTITAGPGSETIYGGPGNDIIHGGSGNDLINGGNTVPGSASGYDQIVGATSTDTLTDDFASGIPANVSHPTVTYQDTTDFTTGAPSAFNPAGGSWAVAGGIYQASTNGTATSTYSLVASQATFQEIQATVQTQHESGLIYDYLSSTNYKFLAIETTGQVILGHATTSGLVTDASVHTSIQTGSSYILALTVTNSAVTAYLNNAAIKLSYAAYSGSLFGGKAGLFSTGGNGSFTDFVLRGNDPSLVLAAVSVRHETDTPATPDVSATTRQSVNTVVATSAATVNNQPTPTLERVSRPAKAHHAHPQRQTHRVRTHPQQKMHAHGATAKWSFSHSHTPLLAV